MARHVSMLCKSFLFYPLLQLHDFLSIHIIYHPDLTFFFFSFRASCNLLLFLCWPILQKHLFRNNLSISHQFHHLLIGQICWLTGLLNILGRSWTLFLQVRKLHSNTQQHKTSCDDSVFHIPPLVLCCQQGKYCSSMHSQNAHMCDLYVSNFESAHTSPIPFFLSLV